MRPLNPAGLFLIAVAAALAALLLAGGFRTIGLNEELHKDCNLPEAVCPFKRELPTETLAGLGISGALGVLGAVLLVRGSLPRVQPFPPASPEQGSGLTLPPTPAERQRALEGLDEDEKAVYALVERAQGFLFQNELVEKSGMHKVKVTRVLDKLEGRGLVERRRRGMGNVVVLRHR